MVGNWGLTPLTFLAALLFGCDPRLPLPASDDPLIGCWSGEDFQPVLNKRTTWLMERRSDGTFSVEFLPVGEETRSSLQIEEGIWTHSNGHYKTITLRINGLAVDVSDPHFTDEYEVVAVDGNAMRYFHAGMKVTFESKKVACARSSTRTLNVRLSLKAAIA